MSLRLRDMIAGMALLAVLIGTRGRAGAVLFEMVLGDADGNRQVSLPEAQQVINNFLGAANVLSVECPPDMVQVGSFCIDKYEASVWRTTNRTLITQIKNGTATPFGLINGGAVQQGVSSDNYTCADNAQDCDTIYLRRQPRRNHAGTIHHLVPGTGRLQQRR